MVSIVFIAVSAMLLCS